MTLLGPTLLGSAAKMITNLDPRNNDPPQSMQARKREGLFVSMSSLQGCFLFMALQIGEGIQEDLRIVLELA